MLTVNGGTIGSAAMVEALTSGTVVVGGTVSNAGTLYASGVSGLLQITSAAVVNGGVVEVGNGTVDIKGAGSENITFQAGGSGVLDLDDATAFTGKVSGFGGPNHTDSREYIDLTGVIYSAGAITSSYSGNSSSGVLTVSSGVLVATLDFVGSYSSSNFHISSVSSGTHSGSVEITDPSGSAAPSTVIAGGGVVDIATPHSGNVTFTGSSGTLVLDQPATFTGAVSGFGAQDGIDLSQIAFGANVTLGYSENDSGTGGTLSVSDGTHAANIALLGNYMAASFVTAADGHGSTLVTETSPQTGSSLLAQPHAT